MAHLLEFIGTIAVLYFTFHILNQLQTRKWRLRKMKAHECQEPPKYPQKDPIFGLDLYLDDMKNRKQLRFLDGMKCRWKEHGQTFTGNILGRTTIYTVDADNLHAVQSTKFSHFGLQPLRRAATLPFLGEGVFTMDGPFWEHSRALIRPTFTKANIVNLESFETHFQKFLNLLPKDNSTVDLKPLLYRLFTDTSSEFLFGETMNTLTPSDSFQSNKFLDAFNNSLRGMGVRLSLGKLMFLHHDRKWAESIKIAHNFINKYVEKAVEFQRRASAVQVEDIMFMKELKHKAGIQIPQMADGGERHVLLHEMAKVTDNRDDLRNQILHVFLAGHGSTAITIGNAIFHLCRKPGMWEMLRQEVLAIGTMPLTFEGLRNLQYLQSVIKETLRLHPVAPIYSRIAYQDTVLPTGGGPIGTAPIFVPKGTMVVTSFHALHRLAPCFQSDEPEVFKPERWETVRPGLAYQPFGGGIRMCPAQQLALTEVAYVLARMAQQYKRIQCRDETIEWVEQLGVTASSRNGVLVGLSAS